MTVDEMPIDQPVALVLGTEMKGVSDIIMDEADFKVQIPMYGFYRKVLIFL